MVKVLIDDILTANCAAGVHQSDCNCRNAPIHCVHCGRYESAWHELNSCRSCWCARLVERMRSHTAHLRDF